MCKVSSSLKLCTCDAKKLPENYWIFHRFNAEKEWYVVGETMLPYFISADDDEFNRNLLLKLLNEKDVFDIEMNPQNKDRLQLTFKPSTKSHCIYYGFEYLNGKWIHSSYDWHEWQWHHDRELSGEIRNAMQK